jgi:hypothetical protein
MKELRASSFSVWGVISGLAFGAIVNGIFMLTFFYFFGSHPLGIDLKIHDASNGLFLAILCNVFWRVSQVEVDTEVILGFYMGMVLESMFSLSVIPITVGYLIIGMLLRLPSLIILGAEKRPK